MGPSGIGVCRYALSTYDYNPFGVNLKDVRSKLSVDPIGRDVRIKMVTREKELRNSDEVQELYNDVELRTSEAIEIGIQKIVLREFNIEPTNDNLKEYQTTYVRYHDDDEFKATGIQWMNYTMHVGDLTEGDVCPNPIVKDLQLNDVPLHSLLVKDRPNVIIAGSWT
jgi:hypothetical protein